MKVSLKYWRSSIALVVVVMALMGSTMAFAQNPNPGVLPPNSHPHGITYGRGSNAWWQWALSIPTKNNPLLDTTGANCGQGQSGPVWFLAGTLGGGLVTRSCTVPAGKTLFFPTINFFQNNVGVEGNTNCPPTDYSVPQMWGILNKNVDSVTTHEATVDGVPQQDHRAGPNNTPYNVKVPADNLFTYLCGNPPIPAGTYSPNVSDGYYVMLAPLKPGTHTIHFIGATSAPFTTEVTYNLTVK